MTQQNTKGFTLIEALIYIAILALVVTTLVKFVLTISQSRNKNYVAQEVQGNMRVAFDIIGKEIRKSTDIAFNSSTLQAHPGVLTLRMASSSIDPTVFLLREDGTLILQRGKSPSSTVTSNAVRVSEFIFTNTSGSSTRKNVRLTMTVQSRYADSADVIFSQSMETVFGIRK